MTYIGTDTAAPTVTSTSPSNNATNIPVTTSLTATFSEKMVVSSVNISTIIVKKGTTQVSGSVTYDSNTKRAIFIPPGNLTYSTTYTVTITAGVEDMAGNNMQADHTWSFTTEDPQHSSFRTNRSQRSAGNNQVNITWDAVTGAISITSTGLLGQVLQRPRYKDRKCHKLIYPRQEQWRHIVM